MADYVVVDREQLEADLTTVSDSIRGLIETEEKLEFPQGMKEAVESYSLDEPLTTQDALIEQIKTALQGKASGGEDLLQYATLNNNSLFREAVFPEAYHAIVRFKGNTSNVMLSMLFAYSNVEKATIGIENTPVNGVNISSWFAGCRNIKEITFENDNLKVLNLTATFNDCLLLESVNGKLDISNCATSAVNNAFMKCYALKEVRFTENSIKVGLKFYDCILLSDDSIRSIIDGLADLTGQETQTLTFHADVKAKLTEDQITAITGNNWTLA